MTYPSDNSVFFKCEHDPWKEEWTRTKFIPPLGMHVDLTCEKLDQLRGLFKRAHFGTIVEDLKQVIGIACQHGTVEIEALRWGQSWPRREAE